MPCCFLQGHSQRTTSGRYTLNPGRRLLLRDETFIFGPFQFSPSRGTLRDAGRFVRLGNRAMEVLALLVEHAGKLVSHEEIVQRVWPNTFVSESNLRVHIRSIRRALHDDIGGDRYVLNVPGRGYRFVAPVCARPSDMPGNGTSLQPPKLSAPRLSSCPPLHTSKRRMTDCLIVFIGSRKRFGDETLVKRIQDRFPRGSRYLLGRDRLCRIRHLRSFPIPTGLLRHVKLNSKAI